MSANSPKLVGVIGRAQHGKTSIGQVLEQYHGFRPVAFADALRDAMLKLDPIVIFHGPPRNEVLTYSDVMRELGYEEAKRTIPEVRRLLQVLGTEVVRDLVGENAWVDALDRTIFDDEDDLEQFVITDVRFPNEANYVRRNKGILIKVVRPNFDNDVPLHASERYVDELPFDYMVTNDGSLDDLAFRVEKVMILEHLTPKARWQRDSDDE